jgi:UDP-galactopyranose mutase
MKTHSPLRSASPDLLCFSHLRWDFVFQRPQHLMTRFAERQRVYFVEEPEYRPGAAELRIQKREAGLTVITPQLPVDHGSEQEQLKRMLNDFVRRHVSLRFVSWYYSPMFLPWSAHIEPEVVVYDCMDELSAFKGAPPNLLELEEQLLQRADLVFTGGHSLYEAKKHRNPNVYPFVSSIDVAHFAQARQPQPEPEDQQTIPSPRIGFFGVLDERLDIELLDEAASLRPDWHFILIGPVVKIDNSRLPRKKNIHYLGAKSYKELPQYIGRWDAAMIPFARNESTRFISPTKTPEYLAAGLPVVSTSIQDVIRAYGSTGLVHIADQATDFVAAIERGLGEEARIRLPKVDALLSMTCWSKTWGRMAELIDDLLESRLQKKPRSLVNPLKLSRAAYGGSRV